jgi:hypothetical protein
MGPSAAANPDGSCSDACGTRHQTTRIVRRYDAEAVNIEIASDNSCLFNAVGYLCTGLKNRAHELHQRNPLESLEIQRNDTRFDLRHLIPLP